MEESVVIECAPKESSGVANSKDSVTFTEWPLANRPPKVDFYVVATTGRAHPRHKTGPKGVWKKTRRSYLYGGGEGALAPSLEATPNRSEKNDIVSPNDPFSSKEIGELEKLNDENASQSIHCSIKSPSTTDFIRVATWQASTNNSNNPSSSAHSFQSGSSFYQPQCFAGSLKPFQGGGIDANRDFYKPWGYGSGDLLAAPTVVPASLALAWSLEDIPSLFELHAQNSGFGESCYGCGCPGHSQNSCPLRKCGRCSAYGHSEKNCLSAFSETGKRTTVGDREAVQSRTGGGSGGHRNDRVGNNHWRGTGSRFAGEKSHDRANDGRSFGGDHGIRPGASGRADVVSDWRSGGNRRG